MQWKRLIGKKIVELNEDDLMKQSQSYKKLNLAGEKFGCKDYIREMKIDDARAMFKIRSNMLPTVQMNFMSERKFADNGWTCSGCSIRKDSQQHLLICPRYADLRVSRNLKSDSDLVAY